MTDRLLLDHHHCRYRVPRAHPDPAAVRRRLERVVAERIPARLADALSAVLPPGDGVVVIRRLGVRVLLGGTEPDLLAATDLWARGLATAIVRALDRDDGTVARYPSRAAYLAAFLQALGTGDAFARWEFGQFTRWRALGPAGAATAACQAHPDDIAPALATLAAAPGEPLRQLLAMLSVEEAARIAVTAGLRRTGPGPLQTAVLGGADAVVRALRSGRQFAASADHLALWLLASLYAPGPGAARPTDADVRRAIGEVAAWGPELAESGLLDAPDATDATPRAADNEHRISLLHKLIPDLVTEFDRFTPDRSEEPATGSGPLTSGFAGCALLLAGLGSIDLEHALCEQGVPPAAAPSLAGRLRWWALLSALGREHRPRARFDPVLARLAGDPGGAYGADVVEGLLPAAVCTTLQDQLRASPRPPAEPAPRETAHLDIGDLIPDPDVAAVVQTLALLAVRDLGRRLPGFSASSVPYIAVNLLVGAGRFRFEPAASTASLPDVPLRVALQMAGWEDRVVAAPWLPGGALRFCRDDP